MNDDVDDSDAGRVSRRTVLGLAAATSIATAAHAERAVQLLRQSRVPEPAIASASSTASCQPGGGVKRGREEVG